MHFSQITKLVATEGLIGLQKLEAQGVIKGDFSARCSNILQRSIKDTKIARAIANGLGRHADLGDVLEMLDWLREGDYLVDYGQVTVVMAAAVTDENPSSLETSEYLAALRYFDSLMEEENEIFCVDFLLDHEQLFRQDVIAWLWKLKENRLEDADQITVKTSLGYSYVFRADVPECPPGQILYTEFCGESGCHYSRYRGYYYCD